MLVRVSGSVREVRYLQLLNAKFSMVSTPAGSTTVWILPLSPLIPITDLFLIITLVIVSSPLVACGKKGWSVHTGMWDAEFMHNAENRVSICLAVQQYIIASYFPRTQNKHSISSQNAPWPFSIRWITWQGMWPLFTCIILLFWTQFYALLIRSCIIYNKNHTTCPKTAHIQNKMNSQKTITVPEYAHIRPTHHNIWNTSTQKFPHIVEEQTHADGT